MNVPAEGKGISVRLALAVVAMLVLLSVVACQIHGDYGDLDINKLVALNALVVEGTVVGQTSGVNTAGRDEVPYTVYELEVAKFWKGNAAELVPVTVPNTSSVRLRSGEQYLLFLGDPAPDGEVWSGHRYLNHGSHVWNVGGNTFRVTNPGGSCCLDPITREELAEIIEKNRN